MAASVLNQKFGASDCGGRVVAAEALDAGKDVIGGFGPAERLWVGVVLVDERGDRGVERGDAAVDAAADLPLGEQREEALDLIEPGRAGRCVMDVPARSPGSQLRTIGALCVA